MLLKEVLWISPLSPVVPAFSRQHSVPYTSLPLLLSPWPMETRIKVGTATPLRRIWH
jgi:hypothetical protein